MIKLYAIHALYIIRVYVYIYTREKHTKRANAGFKNFYLARFKKLDDDLKKKKKKKNRESGWKVKRNGKIRKIVVRCEPRTLAAGQPTPDYFAYTSPVKIPGSSVSTPPHPLGSSPICHPHKHRGRPPLRFQPSLLQSPPPRFFHDLCYFCGQSLSPLSSYLLFRTPSGDIEKIMCKETRVLEIGQKREEIRTNFPRIF